MAFPAHLGPNALLFIRQYVPARYRNGAFIAFRSQSAELKKGYLIAFVPFVNGKAGKWEIFADNFAGTDLAEAHRADPASSVWPLAQGPDGALYVTTNDLNGTLFKVTCARRSSRRSGDCFSS